MCVIMVQFLVGGGIKLGLFCDVGQGGVLFFGGLNMELYDGVGLLQGGGWGVKELLCEG